MEKEAENKNEIISELVLAAAKPVLGAKNYWHQSIYNTLKSKKEIINDDKEYELYLKSELIYFRKLWNNELDLIYNWAEKGKIPEPGEINNSIEYIENQSETCIEDGKIKFKNGKNMDKNDLTYIERYTAIPELGGRIAALEEDNLYSKIRDYITLNVFQFISHNEEFVINLLKSDSKETVQRIADLVANFADICMYPDLNEG